MTLTQKAAFAAFAGGYTVRYVRSKAVIGIKRLNHESVLHVGPYPATTG